MLSPLDRSAAVTPLRHHGVLVRLVGLVLLCAAWIGAAARPGPTAGSSAPSHAIVSTQDVATVDVDLALPKPGEDRSDGLASCSGDEDGLEAIDVTESEEEIGGPLALHGFVRYLPTSEVRALRDRGPLVEVCCVLVSPSRAPPMAARMAG